MTGCGVSIWGDENVEELASGDGYTTVSLKVSLIFSVLWHN
jgi:hypothetical protein